MADWGLIATATATGGLVIFNYVKESQAKKKRIKEAEITKRFGLGPNPGRCGEHKERLDAVDLSIRGLETRVAVIDTKVTALEKCADEIRRDVAGIREKV
jgi:hypothetical protein